MTSTQNIVRAWLEEAAAGEQTPGYAARRTEPRYDWYGSLELKSGDRIHYVQTRDISKNGIGINSRLLLQDGEAVYIRRGAADPWIPAKVRRTTQTVGGYKVGVGFDLEIEA